MGVWGWQSLVATFVFLNMKVVSMELSPWYSTADFLLAYSCHFSVSGIPMFVHSDKGLQLVAAYKDLTNVFCNMTGIT